MASPPRVIGLGELLWDVFPEGRKPGGAPANVAFQAQQLGCCGTVVTRVGNDADGDELVAYLREKGLDVSAVQRDAEYPTGRVTVAMSDSGTHTFTIHEQVAWDHLQLDDATRHVLADAAAICFGTLAQRSAPSLATIQSVLDLAPATCLRVFDVNLRQQFYSREVIITSLQRAQVLKLNEDEVPIVGALLDWPTEPESFCRQVLAHTPVQTACVTRGAQGCLLLSGDAVVDVPGIRVNVIDTVGAGDAFTAGLIVGLLHGWALSQVGQLANRVGAMVAASAGAMPQLDFAQLLVEVRGES
ncbi:MAG: carbohydrate kinase [Planctomycetaceae bacterium]|nr:carbohydrate kinase [Planctomycetaceae bacterium]